MRALRLPAAACAIACLLAVCSLGCGGGSKASTPAALKLEREDLVQAVRALRSAQGPIAREVAATKAAWPLIVNGLPAEIARVSRSPQARAAAESAGRLRLPALFGEAQARSLAGPAAQISGLVRSYALLSARGWKLLDAAIAQIESAPPANAHFARENAPLYIESIYDAHFALAQVGKKLLAGYEKLGGPGEFGAQLSQGEVNALARAYSEPSDRLHPHVGVRLGS
jgi:hypothetical protein